MLNCELVGYIQLITDIPFIEKFKLSFSHHFYSNNTNLKDIKSYCIVKYGKLRKKHNKITFRT